MLTLYESIMKTLGQRIRELREKQDISLRAFALKMDITAAHQSDIELGRRYPSDALLEKFAKELDVPLKELQQFDNRVPVDDIKRIIQADPAFGFALRTVVDKDVKADDLFKVSKNKPDREKE